ncbi:hypothetical protein N7453_010684 [Penicillium expansum]|nr:hypothetical protein N7453_010684 [Penicillium expansum]
MTSPASSLPMWEPKKQPQAKKNQQAANICEVEDYRSGYPRLTALLSSHTPYFICRSFTRLRARVLLLKQDKISLLEQKLDQLDEQESCPLFLGKSRNDKNLDRRTVLSEIDSCLTDYDNFLDRTHRILELSPPSQRDVESLQNWLDGTGAVARDERVYLTHFQDLVTVAPTGDTAVVRLETWIEDKMIRYYGSFRKGLGSDEQLKQYSYS